MQKKTLALAVSSMICSGAYAQDSTKKSGEELDVVEVTTTASAAGHSVTHGSSTGATKMDVSLKDTPRSVVTIGDERLEDISADDVGDVFGYVAGFNRNGTADRSFVARGVRTGISNMLVDGMRTLQGGEAGTGSRFPSTYNAESVTFLRGGDGTLYGPGLGGGMINIETKKPQAESETNIGFSTRSYASGDTGYFKRNSFALNLSSTGKVTEDESVLYLVNAELSPNRQMYQDPRKETDNYFDAALAFNFGNTTITPKFEYGNQKRTGGSSYGDGFVSLDNSLDNADERGRYYGSPDDEGKNTYKQGSLRIDHEFNDNWKAFAAFRYNKTDSSTLDLYTTNSTRPVENLPFVDSNGRTVIGRKWVKALGHDTYKALDANIEGKFQLGATEHHLLLGANYLDSKVDFFRGFQSGSVIEDAQKGTGGSPIDVKNPDQYQVVGAQPDWDIKYRTTEEKNLNIYARDRMRIGDVTLIGGLGYTYKKGHYADKTDSNNAVLYDVGAIYHLNDDVNLFANMSRTYDYVSARQVAQYGNGQSYDPIEGYNYELGVKGDFLDDRVSASATLFNLTRENGTSYERDSNGNWLLKQGSGTNDKSRGLEIEIEANPTDAWTSSLSYAYTDSKTRYTNGDAVKWGTTDYAPKHSLALWNEYRFTDKWSADVGIRYNSKTYDYGSLEDDGSISVKNKFKSEFEVDTGVTYTEKDWTARLSVKNLFDQARVVSGSSPQQLKVNDPRSVHFTFNYKF